MAAPALDSPLYLIVIPALGALLVAAFGRLGASARHVLAVATLLVNLLLALRLMAANGARELVLGGGALSGWQLSFTLRADALSGLLLVAVAFAVLAIAYASALLADRPPNGEAAMLLATAAANGVLLAGDLLTLYSFALLTSLFLSFALLREPSAAAQAAGFKLLAAVEGIGLALLLAILLIVSKGGGLDLATGRALAGGGLAAQVALLALAARSGLAPLHTWLTETLERVEWWRAALAGVLGGIAGIYGLLRVGGKMSAAGSAWQGVLLLLGAATLLVAAYMALQQRDVRHTIAALLVGQGGLCALGLGAGNALGVEGALAQLTALAVAVPLPFVALGTLLGSGNAAEPFALPKAVARRPLAGLVLLAALLSAAGLPPSYSFYGRLYVLQALLAGGGGGRLLAALVVLVASGALVGGTVRLLAPVFGSAEVVDARQWWEGRRGGAAPLLLAAAPTFGLALAPLAFHGTMAWPALQVLGGAADAGLVSGIWLTALLLLAALFVGGWPLLAGKRPSPAAAWPAMASGHRRLPARIERWAEAGYLDPYNWAVWVVGSAGWLAAGVLGWVLDRLAI